MQSCKKNFEIKNLSEYGALYLKSDTLLPDVFKNVRKMSIEMYELDPVKFL